MPMYVQGTGEDAPMTNRGIRDLRILIAILVFPIAYLVYLAVRALA
jgi:hypothetical protein